MHGGAIGTVALAALLVAAGCLGTAPGSPSPVPSEERSSPAAGAPSTASATTGSPAPAETAAQGSNETLPSVDRCPIGALPRPDATDGLRLSPYPEPPATVNRSTVAAYAAAFEAAYLRNGAIADAGTDPEMNLTRARTHAQPENAIRYRGGFVVVLAASLGTTYESGIHGDRWPTVGYFLNRTLLVRSTVDDVNATVGPDSGTTLLRCGG